MKSKINENYLWTLNEVNKSKTLKEYFKNSVRMNVFDVVISGVFLAINIMILLFAKWTILRVIPLEIEFVFYIFFGLMLGPIKGPVLAILSDTLVMLFTSSIGLWYWIYAIIPPLISLVASLYGFLFEKYKTFRWGFSPIAFLSVYAVLLWIFINKIQAGGDIQLNYSVKNPIFISRTAIILSFVIFSALLFSAIIGILIFMKLKLNSKAQNYILIFSLICLTILLFRWILGPIAYIKYYNQFFAKNNKLKSIGQDYLIILIPILLKSFFTITFYTLLLSPVYTSLQFLRTKYLDHAQTITYK